MRRRGAVRWAPRWCFVPCLSVAGGNPPRPGSWLFHGPTFGRQFGDSWRIRGTDVLRFLVLPPSLVRGRRAPSAAMPTETGLPMSLGGSSPSPPRATRPDPFGWRSLRRQSIPRALLYIVGVGVPLRSVRAERIAAHTPTIEGGTLSVLHLVGARTDCIPSSMQPLLNLF